VEEYVPFAPVLLNSKPVGAVTVISAVRLEPETVSVCVPDAVPAQVEKEVNVPVNVTTG